MITFEQYNNQEDPQKMSVASVLVHPNEAISVIKIYGGNTRVFLRVDGAYYIYQTNINPNYPSEPRNTLYTTDEEGNPQKPSVFTLINVNHKELTN
jgi:hypothetical protein